jgi:thioredoxin 1
VAKVLDVTDATFEQEVLKSELPVLVDFWAEWCAPCRALAPVVKDIAASYDGRLRVVKLDVDSSPAAPARFQVRAMPTLLFFKNGQVVDSIVGAVPKQKIEAKLSTILA